MKGNVSVVGKSIIYFLMFMVVLNSLLDYAQKSKAPPPPSPQLCESNEILNPAEVAKQKDPSSRYKYWVVDKSKPKLPDYKRYVTYNQNNGFNNQWIEFQHSIYLALLLNRTLIMPLKLGQKVHLAKHRNWGDYFDLDDLGRGVSFVHQSELSKEFVKSLGEGLFDVMWSYEPNATVYTDILDSSRYEIANGHDLYPILELKKNPNQIFKFPHLWGPRAFFTLPDYVEEKLLHITNNYLHFKDEFFIKALRIVDILGEGYAAAHIRTTDMHVNYYYRHILYMPDMVSRKTKIYIATDAQYIGKGKGGTSADLQEVFGTNIYSWSNFSHLFNDTTPEQAQDNDYVGTIEQCVCVMAKQFFGTKGSTFSAKIVKMRALYRQSYMQKHFDTFP